MSEYASGINNPEEHQRTVDHIKHLDGFNTESLKSYVEHLESKKNDLDREIRGAQSLIDHREAAPQEYLWEDEFTIEHEPERIFNP